MKRIQIIIGLAVLILAATGQFWVLTDSYITPRTDVDIRVGEDQELILASPVWDDLRFGVSALKVSPVSNKPDFDSANVCFLFDKAATEMVMGVAQLPHSYKTGTALSPHIHWSPATDDSGYTAWRLEYKLADINGSFPTSWSADTIVVESDSSDVLHQLDGFDDITMTSYTGVSVIMLWRVSRLGGLGTDTYDNDARFYEFDIHYQKDRMGSINETSR